MFSLNQVYVVIFVKSECFERKGRTSVNAKKQETENFS